MAAFTAAVTAFAGNVGGIRNDAAENFRQFALQQAGLQLPEQKPILKHEKTEEQRKTDALIAKDLMKVRKSQIEAQNQKKAIDKIIDEGIAKGAPKSPEIIEEKAPVQAAAPADGPVIGRGTPKMEDAPYFGGQGGQPFYAYGNLAFSGTDVYLGTKESDAKRVGGSSMTYDAEGKLVHSEDIYPEIDEDGTVGLYKAIRDISADENSYKEYMQEKNGEWVLISDQYNRYNSSNDRIEGYTKYRYYDAVKKEYSYRYSFKIESEYDASGRVISTISYFSSSGNLVPDYKYEYEYSSDGIPTKTYSYFNGEKWIISSKSMNYTDENGVTYYEYYGYNNDTQSWTGYSKSQTKNNEAGNTEWSISWSWNSTDKTWRYYSKYEYEYNSAGNNTTTRIYNWSTTNEDWWLSRMYGYEYQNETIRSGYWYREKYSETGSSYYTGRYTYDSDALGRRTTYTTYNLADAETMTWTPASKETYVYLNNTDLYDDTMTEKIVMYWNTGTGEFVNSYKYEWGYDDAGNNTLYIKYEWSSSDWKITEKELYAYALIGNDLERTLVESYYYSSRYNALVGSYKNEYDFDAKGNQTMYANYTWDYENSLWYGNEKIFYNYDDEDQLVSETSYDWDYTASDWKANLKTTYGYGPIGNIIKEERFEADFADGTLEWVPTMLLETKYDGKGRVIERIEMEGGIYYGGWYYGHREVSNYDENGYPLVNESYVWDSSIKDWVGREKETFEYDYFQNQLIPVLAMTYEWGEEGDWVIASKTVFTPDPDDSNHFVSSITILDEGEWILVEKTDITVDFDAKTMVAITQEMDWMGEMTNSEKQEISMVSDTALILTYEWSSYDEEWNLTGKEYQYSTPTFYSTESYTYDSYSESWRGENKQEVGYNAAGQEIMWADYYWEWDGRWVGNSKYEDEYDARGNQILYAYYYWDNDKWIGSYKSEYAFDSKGYEILNVQYEWDFVNSCWYGYSKYICAYDANDNRILSESYNDTEDGIWIGSYKEEYAYNENNDVTMYIDYDWDNDTKAFVGRYKEEIIYNAAGDRCGYADYEWDSVKNAWVGTFKMYRESGENYMITESYVWNEETGTWVGTDKRYETYTDEEWQTGTITDCYKWTGDSWVKDYKETSISKYRTDYNADYAYTNREKYNANGSLTPAVYYKTVYKYIALAKVDNLLTPVQITTFDGCISIEAEDSVNVTVNSLGGARVASVKGSARVAVPAGIYMVTVDGQTSKIIVR